MHAPLDQALSSEWLETNGLGGYASSTAICCPTRRYHGLLITPPPGYSKRHLFLSRYEEALDVDGQLIHFSATAYPDIPPTQANALVKECQFAPHPSMLLRIGDIGIRREIMLLHGQQVTLCRYQALQDDVHLQLRPLLPFREADALTVENDALDPETEVFSQRIRCQPYASLPALNISHAGANCEFAVAPTWYKNLEYSADIARGYDGHEDQFSPGILKVHLRKGEALVLAAGIDGPAKNPDKLWQQETARRAKLQAATKKKVPAFCHRTFIAAEDFLYRSETDRLGIIAGFPWFLEWGRDTFISLPGLTLARGDKKACDEVLGGALEFLQNGLLPNIYGMGTADSRYNSVDASLWFARAVQLYAKAGCDEARLLEVFLPALEEIAEGYMSEPGLGIKVDADCLLSAGGPELNPTWMDACTAAGPVTPRAGYAVEINALWYSLLQHLESLLQKTGKSKALAQWQKRRRSAKQAFLQRFWLADEAYLADLLQDGRVDKIVRPNMVLAASLELSPLNKKMRQGVVQRATDELLTPRGLRTLSPNDPAYLNRYDGDPDQRDHAYHQGTVWPWLLGFFCEASLRAQGTSSKLRRSLLDLWEDLSLEMDRAGIHHISEVFDGDLPQRPGGTIAQAWNTAEMLRACSMLKDNKLP